ncbi:translation initiation factor IF-3 [bacterium B13(2017)]|nr:translation initiation factor IF-3 [bacterium B13(2017)]
MLKNISNQKLRINREIRSAEVRLIGDDGKQLGIIPTKKAIELAQNEDQDLVEVNPNATPSVCRVMDYGKYKYRQTKKEKEAKKRQHVIKVKEIKLRPAIDEHDCNVKLENAKKFLEKGNKVKLTLMFRGRELAHKEIGEAVLKRFCESLVESKFGAIESNVKRIGRNMTMVVAPLKTK